MFSTEWVFFAASLLLTLGGSIAYWVLVDKSTNWLGRRWVDLLVRRPMAALWLGILAIAGAVYIFARLLWKP